MDAQIFKGGTPPINYGQGAGFPTLYHPPFGRRPFDTSPPFNAHYDGAAPSVSFAAGAPLKPSELGWQKDNLAYADLMVGDTIQMVLVPTNHWIDSVRFDVNNHDPRMAGATVEITGQRIRVDPSDPNKFLAAAVVADFAAAIAAQGVSPIPLDMPSSTVLWLSKILAGGATGDAPAGGGPITNGGASGYVTPLYVEPEFVPDASGIPRRYETGGLLIGVKILTLPTTGARVADTGNDFYLTTRVTGYDCPSFI
jgi:hypothetical protein